VRCHAVLPAGALVCSNCHALVNAERLEQMATAARLHEERHELSAAREVWVQALELLPPQSLQAEWIRNNVRRLETALAAAPEGPARNA
jgi:hypothetical protein